MSQFYVDESAPHLGGFIVGGDEATYYPELWTWLVEKHGVQSMIDVGCGEGHAVDFFTRLGADAWGVDGVQQPHHRLLWHDYTVGPFVRRRFVMDEETMLMETVPIEYDLAWCCEFVEHVEERYVPNFLATFRQAGLVLMTHAEPGQQGHHHVNCQPAAYWQGAMAAIGYELDVPLTETCRALAGRNPNQYNHFARSGLAFISAASGAKVTA